MSHTVYEDEDYKGCTIQIVIDEDSYHANPRDWYNVSTLTFWGDADHLTDKDAIVVHNRYGTDFTGDCEPCEGSGYVKVGTEYDTYTDEEPDSDGERQCGNCGGSGETTVTCTEYLKQIDADVVLAFPIRWDGRGPHSTVGTCDEDDANGIAYVTKDKMGEVTDHKAAVEQELRIFEDWCNGEVFGWIATAPDGEQIESVWGYVGSDEFDHMKSEAKAAIDGYVADQEAEAQQVAYWNSRDVETVA